MYKKINLAMNYDIQGGSAELVEEETGVPGFIKLSKIPVREMLTVRKCQVKWRYAFELI